MSDDLHDHTRPDITDMRAALTTTRAILNGASHGTAHQAAEGGACRVCTAVAGISFMITAYSVAAGDTGVFISEPVRLQLLAAVKAAEDELGGAANLVAS